MRKKGETDEARFLKFVDKSSANGCWEWLGSKNVWGYGKTSIGKKTVSAHRMAYELFVGSIENGLHVCHRCDNRKCVNPRHLFLGTPKDNARDMIAKGRGLLGERHPQAKLSSSQVNEIRKLSSLGVANAEIARKFGVTRTHIGDIVRNLQWKTPDVEYIELQEP